MTLARLHVDERVQRATSHGVGFVGLPAENAAIKNNTPPKEWTLGNIAAMKVQMKRLGSLMTGRARLRPAFRITTAGIKWFFLKLYESGLAYRKKSKVTGVPCAAPCLANEQVVGRDVLAA